MSRIQGENAILKNDPGVQFNFCVWVLNEKSYFISKIYLPNLY